MDAEVKKLSSERQRLAGEVKMKREMEQQYAKRCTLQVQSRFVRFAQEYVKRVKAQWLLANKINRCTAWKATSCFT